MTYQQKLRAFLDKAEKCFVEGDISEISDLFDEKFKFKIYFIKHEKQVILKGGKREFIAIYSEILARGDGYLEWNYRILKSRLTLFNAIKAELKFECSALRKNGNADKSSHIESVVCSFKSGQIKLKRLKAKAGKLVL